MPVIRSPAGQNNAPDHRARIRHRADAFPVATPSERPTPRSLHLRRCAGCQSLQGRQRTTVPDFSLHSATHPKSSLQRSLRIVRRYAFLECHDFLLKANDWPRISLRFKRPQFYIMGAHDYFERRSSLGLSNRLLPHCRPTTHPRIPPTPQRACDRAGKSRNSNAEPASLEVFTWCYAGFHSRLLPASDVDLLSTEYKAPEQIFCLELLRIGARKTEPARFVSGSDGSAG